MPEGRYVLVFRDARFLPCRPGEPPPGAIAEVREPAFRLPAIML
jgi:hypothetical protein